MTTKMKTALLCAISATLMMMPGASFAHDPSEKMPSPTPEQREKMAKMHEQMAACLRSNKPIQDCHKEMMQACEKDKEACPMMHHHGKGMDHGKMQKKGSAQ